MKLSLVVLLILIAGCRQEGSSVKEPDSLKSDPCRECGNLVMVGPADCEMGDEVVFTISLRTSQAALGVIIHRLPPGFVYLDSDVPPSSIAKDELIWETALLPKHEEVTIHIMLKAFKEGLWLHTVSLLRENQAPMSATAITRVQARTQAR